MGILSRFEQRLEGAVRGGFARVFGGDLEPVEIAAALQKEAEAQRVVVSAGRTVAPNAYTVALSPSDSERLLPWSEPLSRELASLLTEHVQDSGWQFYGPVVVELSRDDELDTGMLRVGSEVDPAAQRVSDHPPTMPPPPATVRGPREGRPRLVVPDPRAPGGSREHDLSGATTVIGRGSEADLTIDDTGVSRRHAEVRVTADGVWVTDLGSTNGTRVRGRSTTRAALADGDPLEVGSTSLTFRRDG